MEVIIIYDSAHPSTKIMARAIGNGFSEKSRVRLGDAESLQGMVLPEIDLLIVGCHALRSRPGKAVTGFIKRLPAKALQNVAIASFETRRKRGFLSLSYFTGLDNDQPRAAAYLDKLLIKKGGIHVLPPQVFYFRARTRPYQQSEMAKAARWGHELEGLCRM